MVAGPATTSSTTSTRPAGTGPRRRPGDLGIRPVETRCRPCTAPGDGRPEQGRRGFLDPLPRVPNRCYVEPKSYDYQEFVVGRRVCRQSNEIESEEDDRHDDVAQRFAGFFKVRDRKTMTIGITVNIAIPNHMA